MSIEGSLSREMREWMRKIEAGLLPPDPARLLKWLLDVPADVEHVAPVPPLIEKLHKEFTVPAIERLPRLPMTAEPAFKRWGMYRRERW